MSHVNYYVDRPGSYYDNYKGDKDSTYDGYYDDKYDKLRNEMLGYEKAKSPTQTISLLTTVPQNITPVNIAGRHAPTRHSLRHSRMIVMNKLNSVPNNATSPMERFHKLVKVLAALQIALGLIICTIAFWLYVFAPNIKQRDIPYWSGIPLTISGFMGFFLFCWPHRQHTGSTKSYVIYCIKLVSIFLSLVAGAVCLVASIFAFFHLIGLLFMDCEPNINLNNTCLCTISNSTILSTFFMDSYHYVDLQCHELDSSFVFLMIGSCGGNIIAVVLALWYVYLHWSSLYLYAYSKVQSNALNPGGIIFTD